MRERLASLFPVLNPHGPVAAGELHVMLVTLALCAIVVVPVFFLLCFFAWRYRASNARTDASHLPDGEHYSVWFEVVWWAVPTCIIIVLAVLAWRSSHALDPYKPLSNTTAPVEVDVVALNWKWLFIYPAYDVASVNELVIPHDTPVRFFLTADAPMNSFWVPALAGQIMVMPGMQTELNAEASTAGTFRGLSGNISGAGFSGMSFDVISTSTEGFASWVASAHTAARPLDASIYAELARPSQNNVPTLYSSVEHGLFNSVMMKYMTPTATSTSTHMPSMTMPMENSANMQM